RPALRLLDAPAGERRHGTADQLAAAITEHRVEGGVRDLDDRFLADDRDAFEHRLDHASLRSDGPLGADLPRRLGSDERDRDDLLLRADRADANVEVAGLAVVEHRGVAVDLTG